MYPPYSVASLPNDRVFEPKAVARGSDTLFDKLRASSCMCALTSAPTRLRWRRAHVRLLLLSGISPQQNA